ncbi:hypothetical protein, partial [Mesorhizobium sp.]|uniref:hypothetical protein n=1 Tax=Mesorhizobium sp. TaxID=1871066 RepID=UPI00257A97CF
SQSWWSADCVLTLARPAGGILGVGGRELVPLAVAFGHAAVAATDIHNYLCESDGERPPRG